MQAALWRSVYGFHGSALHPDGDVCGESDRPKVCLHVSPECHRQWVVLVVVVVFVVAVVV